MRYTLTATEFEVAWQVLDLGDLPLIFRVRIDRHGATDEERTRLVASTIEGLRSRGLADGHGLRGDLADALALLAHYDWSVDARLDFHREGRALGVANRAAAVLVVLDADTVTIMGSTPYRLVGDMAGLAGDLAVPAGGKSINLAADVFLAAARAVAEAGDPALLGDELIERGVPAGDARSLGKLNAEMLGGGQFGVQVQDGDGGTRRAPRVVGFCDTHDGRWAQLRTPGQGGQEWLTFTPVRQPQLAAMISDLLVECGVRVV